MGLKGYNVSSYINNNDNIEKFSCGNTNIDHFLKYDAISYEDSSIYSTFIFCDSDNTDNILGFLTYSIGIIDLEKDGSKKSFLKKKKILFNSYKNNDFGSNLITKYPIINLDYLAVNENNQRNNIGKALIIGFIEKMVKLYAEDNIRFIGILTDVISDATDFYEKIGFDYTGSSPEDCRIDNYTMFIDIEKMLDISITKKLIEKFEDDF